METWDAMRSRKNIRTYKQQPIAEAEMQRILEAGWRAPSARNRQPWDFVVVTEPEKLQELSTVWAGARHIAAAPAAIVIVAPVPEDEQRALVDRYDLGQATMAIAIAAADLGIGTAHSSVGDQDKARAILGVPEDHFVAFMLGVGYPEDGPLKPIAKLDRRPFDEVVHHGSW